MARVLGRAAETRVVTEDVRVISEHGTSFHIRPATSEDCRIILGACEADVVDFETRDLLCGKLPFLIFLALDSRGVVVGALEGDLFYNGDGWAWVFSIGVAEHVRRHGVGTALLRAFSEAAFQAGRTYVALRIQDGDEMEARRAFFLRCGLSSPDTDDTLAIGVLADLDR
jgi:GNAT superfamily N-acetyltransferase